jgi:hypothetical protein
MIGLALGCCRINSTDLLLCCRSTTDVQILHSCDKPFSHAQSLYTPFSLLQMRYVVASYILHHVSCRIGVELWHSKG